MKKKKQKTQSLRNTHIIIWLAIALTIVTLFVASQFWDNNSASNNNAESDQNPDQEIQLPIVIDKGRLEVESIFSFSGMNPDADKQEASEIAAIEIKNVSDTYLKTATIEAVFSDGNQQTFIVNDLPAGKTVMAFSIDNLELSKNGVCIEITADTVFENVKNAESVSVTIDGTRVTIKNISEEDLTEIDVYCRDVFDEKYFGGMTYKYSIEKLSTGESAEITVPDSIMGVIDVVRIGINE